MSRLSESGFAGFAGFPRLEGLFSRETLFPCRRDLPVAIFIGRALEKRCAHHPVHPIGNARVRQSLAFRYQTACLGCGGRLRVPFGSAVPPANVETF